MDELMRHTKNAIYHPIDSSKYDRKFASLISSMLTPDPAKRAKLCDVITSDLIVLRYYRSLFDYGYQFNCSANEQAKNNHHNNNNEINAPNN